MRTRLTDLLGIEVPIVQAPMAGSSGAELAVAVAEAGGLGSLPTALLARRRGAGGDAVDPVPDVAPDQPQLLLPQPPRRRSGAAGGVARPDGAATTPSSASSRPAVSSERWSFRVRRGDVRDRRGAAARGRQLPLRSARGRPSSTRVRATGAKVVSSATTVAEARWLAERGCDVVDRPGCRGGRPPRDVPRRRRQHAGRARWRSCPQVVDAVEVPVIAAGGIGDGRGVAAALALGADGVQLGTVSCAARKRRRARCTERRSPKRRTTRRRSPT